MRIFNILVSFFIKLSEVDYKNLTIRRQATIQSAFGANNYLHIKSQNFQGLKDPAKLENILYKMETQCTYIYICLQEMWLEMTYVQKLKHRMTFINHGPEKHSNNRGECRVGIVLSKQAAMGRKAAGEQDTTSDISKDNMTTHILF
jgi:hypothetical protein